MIKRTITATASMEARLAALFVQTASKFQSDIYVNIDEKKVNAKSIMGMISIGILEGQQLTIMADGGDAEAAIAELHGFFMGK